MKPPQIRKPKLIQEENLTFLTENMSAPWVQERTDPWPLQKQIPCQLVERSGEEGMPAS